MMQKIAFIPARCGSKSIPLKNIKNFCGRPLIYWSLKALNACSSIDNVVVATDCSGIKDRVLEFGFDKVIVYDRKVENAQDSSSTEDVMIEYIEQSDLKDNDIFILVQATSPFTTAQDFEEALELYIESGKDSLLSCARVKRFFWNENGEPLNYDYLHRPRRQEFKGIFVENGAFYINRVENIKKFKNRLCGKIAIFEMPEYTYIELDEEDDWPIAEMLMKKYVLKKSNNKRIKLFLSDVDGVLTDAGMYYTESGDEIKKFNTHDGKGFELLKRKGIKTGLITSETTKIVERRAKKLKVDYLFQGRRNGGKLYAALEICKKEKISLEEVAYIGDDINCKELLERVGIAAAPSNAVEEIKNLPGILKLSKRGGEGAVREFVDYLIVNGYCE